MRPHPFVASLEKARLAPVYGHVQRIGAGFVEASGPACSLGELCDIEFAGDSAKPDFIPAEVVALDERGIILIPFEAQKPVRPNARVLARSQRDRMPVGNEFAGRAVDALGRPIDGLGPIAADAHVPVSGRVPAPLERADPVRRLATGVRAIDGLLTLGEGQRVGIFAASGVGKTTLMEQLAGQIACDHCVLCLVGERGREVESIWRHLEKRSDRERYTLVVATSDESAALRARAASYAASLAEYWRSQGAHVAFVLDSVTRFAMALREVGLAAGAPPTVRAYTPNVFASLPRLVERCGAVRSGGAITAVMTVLSETDDVDDPIVELMKSLLDGHIVLSRMLAEQGHFPAIDVGRSVSRGAERLMEPSQIKAAREATALLAAYDEARIMIETGAYKSGSNALVDRALSGRDQLIAFLKQEQGEAVSVSDTLQTLNKAIGGGALG